MESHLCIPDQDPIAGCCRPDWLDNTVMERHICLNKRNIKVCKILKVAGMVR